MLAIKLMLRSPQPFRKSGGRYHVARGKCGAARKFSRPWMNHARSTDRNNKDKKMPGRTASRTYGTVSADRRKEMSGLEFVLGLADRTLPVNTIAQTLG